MRIVFITLLVLLLAACAGVPRSGPDPVPASAGTEQPRYRWVEDLGGRQLAALVDEAWRANPGIDAALAAVSRARAQAVIAGAARWPQGQLALDGSRSKSLQLGRHRIFNRFGLAAEVSWIPDLWGRAAARQRASEADLAAAGADLDAARLLLAADVAKQWLRRREALLQWRLAKEKQENFAATLAVISERYRAGLVEALDVYLAKENLATAKAATLAARQKLDAAARALEALLGRFPAGEVATADALDALPGPVPAGLDSRVLLRRPDIHAWRQRLLAAEARSRDAAKNRFPSFSLTARGGTQSSELADLLDWDNLVWSLAAGLVQPLFDGGRLRAEQLLARANEAEVLANYAKAVLGALREVQTALAAEPLLNEQVALQQEAAQMARRAAELSLANYRAGLIDIDALLTAQRRAFASRSALLAAQLARLLNRIDLHLAIGGDFDVLPGGDDH